nr:hypothetical protein [Tanacetum cinerariifolium]
MYGLVLVVLQMACVAPRSHGGDAGGDPPDDRQPRLLLHQCEGSGKRGESKHKALKKAFKQNGYRKLEIVFEAKDQKTFKPEKPPKWKAGDAQWQKLIDFWSDPNRMKQSDRYAANRAKNKFEENQRYEGLIDHWRRRHSDKDGNFRTRENETLYAEMKAIRDVITAGTIPPKTDRQILAEVTRSTNRAHIAGVGRNLAGTGNLDPRRSQPDLVFPSSISTPGGPSSSSPAPSSTPLGLGNCYTTTFDLETSQSGEQEDNGSDDGNHEYDVDIYDDE